MADGAGTQATGPEIGGPLTEVVGLGIWLHGPGELSDGITTAGEESSASAVGEKAVVADADEATGKDVEEEATDELGQGEREGSGATAAVVLVAEGHGLVIYVEDPMVRDRYAMRVAGEVLEHGVGPLERWLGVDDPLGAAGQAEVVVERYRASVASQRAVQLKALVVERFLELAQELAPEQAAEHAHR